MHGFNCGPVQRLIRGEVLCCTVVGNLLIPLIILFKPSRGDEGAGVICFKQHCFVSLEGNSS